MNDKFTPNADEKVLSTNLFPVVGIGASAGGLDAFRTLLKAIPEKSGMAYVLVQHLAPTHDSLLPELLQKATTIPVLEISDDIKVEPDHIYILPSNKMLVANDGVLQLSPRPTNTGELNLPIDLFFTSLAEIHQSHAIGVVLSGTGSDGTQGLKAIKENGGITVAQDEASAGYDSMPKSAVRAGVVDFVLPPEEIPQKLIEITQILSGKGGDDPSIPESEKAVFNQILSLLRVRTGTDFTHYKQTTIHRRILRRMAITKREEVAHYLTYLRDNQPEQAALFQDLLIPVTSFFRDLPVFDTLQETVFPTIIKNKAAGEPIRIWVAGCSTGQEAYSIAICLRELLDDTPQRVQLFASDLSEPAIAKARTGLYTKAEVASVSPQRLHEFFTKINGNYQLNKSVRDMCVFAKHNFLKDPPFGKLDLISCRNVLIYLEPYLQQKVFTTFQYALNPNGYLLLGKSETIGHGSTRFSLITKNSKLFTRKEGAGRIPHIATQRSELTLSQTTSEHKHMRTDFQQVADELILKNYTPAGVVINEAMDIVHFRGDTTPYLAQSPGKPTHNLLLLAKDGLAFELRNLVHKTKKDQTPTIKDNIPVQLNGYSQTIAIEAVPLPDMAEPHYLLLFHHSTIGKDQPSLTSRNVKIKAKKEEKDLRLQQSEQELAQVREDMRAITQDQEAVNEELQSANEELLSGNEELQSLNEELETSKEELQSTNEELTVVNQEMINLNEQVTGARDYAEAIVATIREPLLVLDQHLRVKSANSSYYTSFQVSEAEIEGKLIYEVGNNDWDIPALKDLLEKILPKKLEFNDLELTHTFQQIGERVMRLNAREVQNKRSEKLILLAIDDITEEKKAEEEQKRIEHRFQFITNAIPQKVWTTDEDGNLNYFNDVWHSYTGLTVEELKNRGWKKIIHPDDWEDYKNQWQHSLDTGTNFELEQRLLNKDGEYKWHLSRGLAYKGENGKLAMLWVGTNTEIQEQKQQQEVLENAVAKRTNELNEANLMLEEQNGKLQQMNKELESFTYVSSHDLQEPLRKIQTLANRILEKEEQTLSTSGKDYFTRIQKSAERMQQLIDDLLAFSRLSTAERKFDNVDLRLLVEEVLGELRETIAEKHATIEVTDLGHAPVIVFQFHQLMHNLIGNALKFSRPDIPPHIRIKSQLIKGSEVKNATLLPNTDYCHITVTDNGIGFDSKYSERIFDLLQRLHGKEYYRGTGIGLAIVKKIIENHNGIITASSESNTGAQFDMYIPNS